MRGRKTREGEGRRERGRAGKRGRAGESKKWKRERESGLRENIFLIKRQSSRDM